jgi:hypothetical protein
MMELVEQPLAAAAGDQQAVPERQDLQIQVAVVAVVLMLHLQCMQAAQVDEALLY